MTQLLQNFGGKHGGLEYDLRTAGVLDVCLRVGVFCFSQQRVYQHGLAAWMGMNGEVVLR